MRTLKQLYELLLQHKDFYTNSICHGMSRLYGRGKISSDEYTLLKTHFNRQRPGLFKHTKFIFHYSYKLLVFLEQYWWEQNDAGNKQRTKFIKHLISKL